MVQRDQAPSPESFPPLPKSCYTARPKSTRRSLSLSGNLSMEGQEVTVASALFCRYQPCSCPPCNLKWGGGKHSSSAGFSALPTSGGGCRLSPGTTSCSVSMCGCDQGTNPSELVVPDRQQRGNQRPEKGFFKRGKRRAALIPPNRKENLSKIKRGPVFSLSLAQLSL